MIVFLIALLIVLYTFQTFFCNLYSKHYRGDSAASSFVFTVLFGLVVGVISLILKGFRFAPSPQTWLLGSLCGLSLFVYNLSLVRATQSGPYSLASISYVFGGLIGSIALSCLVLRQPIGTPAIFGLILMLVALVALNASKLEMTGTAPSFYVWCLLLFLANGAYCSLLALHSTRISEAERPEMLVIAYLGSAVLGFLALALTRKRKIVSDFTRIGKKSWMYGGICWICATTGVKLSQYVLGLVRNVSIYYAALNGGVMVLSVLLSILVLGERPSRIRWVGVALAVVSILLLSV